MPVEVKNIAGKWRVVEAESGQIATSAKHNKPIDGGGHESEDKARRQAGYINAALDRAKKD